MAGRHIELHHAPDGGPLGDLLTGAPITPEELALPSSLVGRIDAWHRRWDKSVDHVDPDVVLVERWVIDELGRDGARLWRALLGLLQPQRYTVSYRHLDVRYSVPSELPIEWRF